MDWARTIRWNHDAFGAILAALFTLLGLHDGVTPGRIERRFHRTMLRVLKPAELAVRRGFVIAARGLVVEPAAKRLGRPSGYREKPTHEVDEVRREWHALASEVEPRDTS